MAAQKLEVLVDEFRVEIDQIRSIFDECRGSNTVDRYLFPYCPFEDGCLISLWDAWNRYLRRLTLVSVAGPTIGMNQTRYTPAAVMNEPAALQHLKANARGKSYRLVNDEPNWHNLMHLIDILNVLNAPNAHVIVAALSASTVRLGPIAVRNPTEEIRECRNFVAHKCDGTLAKVRMYSPTGFSTLTDHLRRKNAGVEVFYEWGDCMIAIAETAAG